MNDNETQQETIKAVYRYRSTQPTALKPKQQNTLQKLVEEYPGHKAVQHVRYALVHHHHRLGNVKQMNRFLKQTNFLEESLCKGIDKLLSKSKAFP